MKFCPFTVIGFPTMKKSLEIVRNFVDAKGPSKIFGKAGYLELGIPFSDPVADGHVIQKASQIALNNGFRMKKLFPFLRAVRKFTPAQIHIGLLTYANPVYRYGIEKFYRDAKAAGAGNILIADLAFEEASKFLKAARKTKLNQVFIVSDKTPANLKRFKKILRSSKPYIYIVSRSDVTGAKKDIPRNLGKLIKTAKRFTKTPLLVGFGISQKSQVRKLRSLGADGFIIGSSLVKAYLNS